MMRKGRLAIAKNRGTEKRFILEIPNVVARNSNEIDVACIKTTVSTEIHYGVIVGTHLMKIFP